MSRVTIITSIIIGMTISISLGSEKFKGNAIVNSEIDIYQEDLLKAHILPLHIWQANQAAINTNGNYIFLKLPITVKQLLGALYLFAYNKSLANHSLLSFHLWLNYTCFQTYDLLLQSRINSLLICNYIYDPELDFEKLAKPLLLENQPTSFIDSIVPMEPTFYIPLRALYNHPTVDNVVLDSFGDKKVKLCVKNDMEVREERMFKRAMRR